jgi:hypothetical protein
VSAREGYSGAGRALWVIWCCIWAVAWLVIADVLDVLHGPWLVALAMVPGSLAGIAFPVGKGQRSRPLDPDR